jgi:hypothetical protein
MSLNPDLVRARCSEIEESVRRLEQFRSISREQFLSNQDWLDTLPGQSPGCSSGVLALEWPPFS